MRPSPLALIALLAGAPVPGFGADILSLEVEREGASFHLAFECIVDAPAERVRALVTDHARLAELSPATKVSRVERDAKSGRERLHLELEPCVWIFCRRLTKISFIEHAGDGSVVYRGVPGAGDFESALERLRIAPAEDGARIAYTAEIVPKFFVPPLIGEWMMERTLARDVAATAARVERELGGGAAQPPRHLAPAPPGAR